MALSKIVVVAFIVIFIGFISLLVAFNVHTSHKKIGEFDDDHENETHVDYLLDLSNTIKNPCPLCPQDTMRDLFCNVSKFALIMRITDISTDPPFLVEKWSQLKKEPEVIGNYIYLDPSFNEMECSIELKPDTVYLVTGYISSNEEPFITPCDAIIDWSALPRPMKLAYFNFFSPVLQC